jgi:hypothetical protein
MGTESSGTSHTSFHSSSLFGSFTSSECMDDDRSNSTVNARCFADNLRNFSATDCI